MTENEINDEIARLEKIIGSGDATVRQANKLDELRRALRQITNVKYGKSSWI